MCFRLIGGEGSKSCAALFIKPKEGVERILVVGDSFLAYSYWGIIGKGGGKDR